MAHGTTRRKALHALGLGGLVALTAPHSLVAALNRKKLPVAAVVTEYRHASHADVIVGKILEGWRQDGGPGPDLELVSMYVDQFPENDMSRGLAKKYGFPIARTIDEAVTLGRNKLPVAAVLSIGEHGNYPFTETGQHMYPRRRFFDEIVAAMQRCGEFVPIFNDKHLSYRWRDAKHMYDTAKRLRIPFMAGSSLPVAWRYPAEELPFGSQIEEVMAIGGCDSESDLFHVLESLQCIAERRRGGESGVKAVTALTGDQVLESERRGDWSRSLLESSVRTFHGPVEKIESQLRNRATLVYLIEYSDGLRATVTKISGVTHEFAVACRLRQREASVAWWFRLAENPNGHFEHLLRAIEPMVHTGKPSYPVERTLLTTGILDRMMHSQHQQGKRLLSPELGIRYQPSSWGFANREEENFPKSSKS